MPELRFDPLGRRHVLLAPERARRGAPPHQPHEADPAPCDFCGGCEDRTPPETFSIRDPGTDPNTPGWRVRVVPNLYPATAFHEVVVHTPRHDAEYERHDHEHRADVLRTYRARLTDMPTDAAVVVWNRGRAAGASRSHPHGQIFGLDTPPPTLEREIASLGDEPCVLCRWASDEVLRIADIDGARLVAHPVPFVADEILVVPQCRPRVEELEDSELGAVADAFGTAISSTLDALGDGVPFNLVVHTAPLGVDRFHWHAHLMPRTAVWGGLEMGAELPIVAGDPYETARRLRA